MFATRDRFKEIVAAAPSGAARKKHPGKAVMAGLLPLYVPSLSDLYASKQYISHLQI
jgi:hypothetical protein